VRVLRIYIKYICMYNTSFFLRFFVTRSLMREEEQQQHCHTIYHYVRQSHCPATIIEDRNSGWCTESSNGNENDSVILYSEGSWKFSYISFLPLFDFYVPISYSCLISKCKARSWNGVTIIMLCVRTFWAYWKQQYCVSFREAFTIFHFQI